MNARALIAALVGGALLSLTGCTTSPVTAPSTPALTFRQPVVDVGQDPFVVRWRNRYLLVQARNDDEIWVLVSPVDDLTGIGARGTAVRIWTAPDHGGACTDVWAPELHRVGSRWIVYYSATTCDGSNDAHRMFAIESAGSDPLSGYRDAGEVAGPADTWSIDGTRFIWHGTAYFVWSGWPDRDGSRQNLYIARRSSTTRLETARVVLSTPSEPWERRGAPINEGPQALRHAGRLFIVYSASGSWTDSYADGLLALTGADPLDPDAWTKSPHPVFQSTGEVFGPGPARSSSRRTGARAGWSTTPRSRRARAGIGRSTCSGSPGDRTARPTSDGRSTPPAPGPCRLASGWPDHDLQTRLSDVASCTEDRFEPPASASGVTTYPPGSVIDLPPGRSAGAGVLRCRCPPTDTSTPSPPGTPRTAR